MVIIKLIPKYTNVYKTEEKNSFVAVIGLMPIYQSAEPFRICGM